MESATIRSYLPDTPGFTETSETTTTTSDGKREQQGEDEGAGMMSSVAAALPSMPEAPAVPSMPTMPTLPGGGRSGDDRGDSAGQKVMSSVAAAMPERLTSALLASLAPVTETSQEETQPQKSVQHEPGFRSAPEFTSAIGVGDLPGSNKETGVALLPEEKGMGKNEGVGNLPEGRGIAAVEKMGESKETGQVRESLQTGTEPQRVSAGGTQMGGMGAMHSDRAGLPRDELELGPAVGEGGRTMHDAPQPAGYDVKPIIPDELKMGTTVFSTGTDTYGSGGAQASDRAANLAKDFQPIDMNPKHLESEGPHGLVWNEQRGEYVHRRDMPGGGGEAAGRV